ncbi:MAG: gephyrin-like molybdotransferase Glp [Acidobacteriota bacterium]
MADPLDLDDPLELEDALDLVVAKAPILGTESVPLSSSLGRVLATDCRSDVDAPPFDRCMMDGYAFRAEDVADAPTSLRLVGTVFAGHEHLEDVPPGSAVKVMTGAPLPPGCDTVQALERTREDGTRVVIHDRVKTGLHVAPKAEEIAIGEVALARGSLIGPAEVGVLALCGCSEVEVHARPLAAVISTGDELVEVGEKPGPAQLRNSNGPMLAVLARQLGCDPVQLLPSVSDDPDSLRAALERGLEADVLLVSGGVSKGQADLVGETFTELGVEPVFHGVKVQPGKPLWFGRSETSLVFGLPGNPVSALTTARIFAGTAIRRMRGLNQPRPRWMAATLIDSFRRNPRRRGLLPAEIRRRGGGLDCRPLGLKGSADLIRTAGANGTWVAPIGQDEFRPGEEVDVLLHEDFADR